MTVLCPRQTPKFSRFTASPQVLITAGTRVITFVSRVFHVCCTSVPRVPPVVVRGLKLWAVQNFLPRPTPFRFFSASCHVYKSTVARLKLDINANNIVCFTGDHFLTGFGRDQAVKRCVTGPLRGSGILSSPEWVGGHVAGQTSPVNTLTSAIFHGSFSNLAWTFIAVKSRTSSIMEILTL